MARLDRRFAEAEAALATFDEAVAKASRSLTERDSAILRMIYTFEALWKACQQLLGDLEDTEVASPNTAIRAARRLGCCAGGSTPCRNGRRTVPRERTPIDPRPSHR